MVQWRDITPTTSHPGVYTGINVGCQRGFSLILTDNKSNINNSYKSKMFSFSDFGFL